MKTCKVYRLPLTTLETWFEKKCNISIWLAIVKSLSFNNVINSIPISPINNISWQSYEENITNIKRMMYGLKKYDMKILTQTKICLGVTTHTHQSIRSNCKVSNDLSFIKHRPSFWNIDFCHVKKYTGVDLVLGSNCHPNAKPMLPCYPNDSKLKPKLLSGVKDCHNDENNFEQSALH